MQQSKVSVKYSEENSVFGRVSYFLSLEFFWGGLLTFSAFTIGAYLRWALIGGWALIRINTVNHAADRACLRHRRSKPSV